MSTFLRPDPTIVLWCVNEVIFVTLVSAVALLIARCFRHRATVRHGLLFTALVLVLVSPAILAVGHRSGLGLVTWDLPQSPETRPDHQSDLSLSRNVESAAEASRSMAVFPEAPLPRSSRSPDRSATATTENATRFDSRSLVDSVTTFALWLWLTGSVLVALRFVLVYRGLRGLIASSTPLRVPSIQGRLAAVCRALGLERLPSLATSSNVESPVAVGVVRQMVILPEWLVDTLTPEQLRQVLVHECAHLARRDPIVVLLQHLVTVVFWFHPLVRRLNRRLALAREEICDNFVLASTDAPSYGRTLLRVAESVGRCVSVGVATGLLAGRWNLETRVAGLLDESRNTATRPSSQSVVLCVSTAFVLGLVATLATLAPAGQAGQPTPAKPTPTSNDETDLPQGNTGLASKYSNDKGIRADPSVLFECDFERATNLGELRKQWFALINKKHLALDKGGVGDGKQSLRITIPKQDEALSVDLHQRLTKTQDVLFLRWYQKFDDGWFVPGRTSVHNGGVISARYFRDGRATPGERADGRNKFLVAFENENTQGPAPGHINAYVYWPEQHGPYGDHFFPSGIVLPLSKTRSGKATFGKQFRARPEFVPKRGRWYCYEFMVEANTPKKRDGRIALWVDGKLIADFPNLRLRDTRDLKIDQFSVGLFLARNPKRVNRKWIDNVVAATSYIGPIDSSE